MKKLVLATLIASLPLKPAFAACGWRGITATVMVLTITSAPTGLTMLYLGYCRDEVLNLQEAAIQYKMTGEMSELLKASIVEAKQINDQLTEDQIVDKFINFQVE
ncbi:MAG: hypothetical protein J7501_04600 [Bdellovibrio sp.]|nr:hypothetical protein [Bdellovibrio sp.]